MKITKRILSPLDSVYAVFCHEVNGRTCLTAATEGYGPGLLFFSPKWEASLMWEGPGGVMCIESIPEKKNALVGIERFFPIFKSEGAGIFVAEATSDPKQLWRNRRVADMPFAHRLRIVSTDSTVFCVVATICGGKKFQDDWSQPGAVYAAPIPKDIGSPWEFTPVLSGLDQNHGLIVQRMDGKLWLLVGCKNGLYRILVPDSATGTWMSEQILDCPVSDMALFDLDGDEVLELATIEPFHGDHLFIYRQIDKTWQQVYRTEVNFGHVIWCGTLLGQPGILAGSRSAQEELAWYVPVSGDLSRFEKVVIDVGIEPTQIDVFHDDSRDLVFSANHRNGEVVLYEITG